MISNQVKTKFLTNTDETGRFIYISERTGKTYFVEPILGAHTPKWGSVDPATGKLMHKKGDGKYTGAVEKEDSLITEENGFRNIQTLKPGISPLHALEVIDSKYPDKTNA